MDSEKLIELVRQHTELYDMGSHKYSDASLKDETWRKIGAQLGRPAGECKIRWISLRDQYRRVMQKKTKSGQAALITKPWKFEVQMNFLKPHFKERETKSNLVVESPAEIFIEDEVVYPASPPAMEHLYPTCVSPGSRKEVGKQKSQSQSASSVLMEYLLKKSEEKEEKGGSLKKFFSSMAETVCQLSPMRQIEAKDEIYKIVSRLEREQVEEDMQKSSDNYDHSYSFQL